MKSYEDVYRTYLPPKNYFILRIDGKAFHSFTKDLEKPFDRGLNDAMDFTTRLLCCQVQGSILAYVQSDEISILFTDLQSEESQIWFGGNIQKIVSVGSSIATSRFNEYRNIHLFNNGISNLKYANFDARVFHISNWIEVYNYFVWRNNDCMRNSVQMVARSLFSHNQLNNKSCSDIIPMIESMGIDWDNYDPSCKYGRIVYNKTRTVESVVNEQIVKTSRNYFVLEPAWVFTKEPKKLKSLIPNYEINKTT